MSGMTRSYVWHASFLCVTWLIHMCGMPHSCFGISNSYFAHSAHSYVWRAFIPKCNICHLYLWHASFMCVTWRRSDSQDAQQAVKYVAGVFRVEWVAVCCSALQCIAVCCSIFNHETVETTHTKFYLGLCCRRQRNCNTLQHTATLCNTLQHTATHCDADVWAGND